MKLRDVKRKNDLVPEEKYTDGHRAVEYHIREAERYQEALKKAKKGFSNDKREAKEELKEARRTKVSKEKYKLMQQDIKEILKEDRERIQNYKDTINRNIGYAIMEHKTNEAKIEKLRKRK